VNLVPGAYANKALYHNVIGSHCYFHAYESLGYFVVETVVDASTDEVKVPGVPVWVLRPPLSECRRLSND
jgi:hypothetical protein